MSPQNLIRIMCPNLACKRVLGVPAHARGKLVRCRSCGINIRIPAPKAAADHAAAPPPASTETKA